MTNEPAFPCECDFHPDGTIDGHRTELRAGIVTGLSKREYFASAALSGLVSNPNFARSGEDVAIAAILGARFAVELADALIERLNQNE